MSDFSDRRTSQPDDDRPVHDLVGVGFGPSNLALAALIEEEADEGRLPALSSLFLERREEFAWHPDMLIDGTRIQLSFLKDLVTLRNPRSRFSFLCYLADQERLEDFVNLREFFPTRREFNDYFRWVAAQVEDQIRFGRQVTRIEPVGPPGRDHQVDLLRVTAQTLGGSEEVHFARNLVLAPGGRPHVPEGVTVDGERVIHCQNFLGALREHYPDRDAPYRFVVVGSGQSAAEIFQYAYSRYPRARVTAAVRRFAYKPADESQFVNEIFHTATVDFLYQLPDEVRDQVLDAHHDTNYSAVDLGLIREIYSDLYERRVRGEDHVELRKLHELQGIERRQDSVVAVLRDLAAGREVAIEADAVFLATGYSRDEPPALLEPLAPYLVSTPEGRLAVDRSYRVRTVSGFRPLVFVQGFSESTHGLSDTLLSVLPHRAREILDSLLAEGHEELAELDPETSLRFAETRS